jgi:CRP/FNR family transcriptional regulator, cyclic AMP receptor protein
MRPWHEASSLSCPAELVGELLAEGERADYPAGTTVYRPVDDPQAALVVRGLVRVYLSSPGGRQVTVRYARPGDVLGIAVLVGGPASAGVQTVEDSSVFRIRARALTEAGRRDPPGLVGHRRGTQPAPV